MVAMMISVVGLTAMAQLLAVTLRMQQLGRNSTEAIRLAQEKADQISTMTFDTTAAAYNPQVACGGSLTADDADHFDDALNDDGSRKGFRRRWVIAAGPDGDTNLRQLTVRVIPDINNRNMASPYEMTTVVRGWLAIGLPPACP